MTSRSAFPSKLRHTGLGAAICLVFVACDDQPTDDNGEPDVVQSDVEADAESDTIESDTASDTPELDVTDVEIAFGDLQDWTRVEEPIYRDLLTGYQVAADPHVFHDADGQLHMFYSGDVDEFQGILHATGSDWLTWSKRGPVISGISGGLDIQRETPFYRASNDGTHQLYYIGYDDEATYQSQVYLAEADDVGGPYSMPAEPVVSLGIMDGHDVRVITSPSVVEHEGLLHMVFLAWDAPGESVTTVWVIGATSTDDGQSWSNFREVPAPIGMEGQLTQGPDGMFYATRTGTDEVDGAESIYLARADNPFGPYESLPNPILVQAGRPYEGGTDPETGDESFARGEANAADIEFDPSTRTAYLYYHGADYDVGYWVMAATTTY